MLAAYGETAVPFDGLLVPLVPHDPYATLAIMHTSDFAAVIEYSLATSALPYGTFFLA